MKKNDQVGRGTVKLTLRSEVLRDLSLPEMRNIAGGSTHPLSCVSQAQVNCARPE